MSSKTLKFIEIAKNSSNNYTVKEIEIVLNISYLGEKTKEEIEKEYINGHKFSNSKIIFNDKYNSKLQHEIAFENIEKQLKTQSISSHAEILNVIHKNNFVKNTQILLTEYDYRSQQKEAIARYKREDIKMQAPPKFLNGLKYDKNSDRVQWFVAFLYSWYHRCIYRYTNELSKCLTDFFNRYGGSNCVLLHSEQTLDMVSVTSAINDLAQSIVKVIRSSKIPISKDLETDLQDLANPKLKTRPGVYVREAIAQMGEFCIAIFTAENKEGKRMLFKIAPNFEHCGSVVIVELNEREAGNDSMWLGM